MPGTHINGGSHYMTRRSQFYGAEGTRTLYLLHAMEALSQMSYNPGLPYTFIIYWRRLSTCMQ